jgi:hypothetical protein
MPNARKLSGERKEAFAVQREVVVLHCQADRVVAEITEILTPRSHRELAFTRPQLPSDRGSGDVEGVP